ncbi:MAG: hypothetical protein IPO72_00455 [Saprospiraceae bacterium]|nr:hypothetical protein [Candidatus Vicinibacter affinis]
MIHKLAIDAGEVFAAVAGTSAPLMVGDSAKTDQQDTCLVYGRNPG